MFEDVEVEVSLMKKTNLWKALFSVVMSIFMVMAMLPSMIFVVYSLDGRGTESAPYLIGSYDDLFEFARLVRNGTGNLYAELVNDIDAQKSKSENWTPIGEGGKVYKGIFNGNDHSIRGLYVKSDDIAGLFREISADAVVKNVKLENSCIEGKFAGGLIVHNRGKISNCSNTGTVTANGEDAYAGGVVAVNYNEVRGCSNSGTVKTNGREKSIAGGVVAINYYEGDGEGGEGEYSLTGESTVLSTGIAIVSDCHNTGVVTAEGKSARVGGVTGENSGEISGCSNAGMIMANGTVSDAGGVVGVNTVVGCSTVVGCRNVGEVISIGDVACAGGVISVNYYEVSGCSNTGNVKVEKTNNSSGEVVIGPGGSFAGGVVALNERKVSNCNNIGTVTVKGDGIYAGGIVGNNADGTTEDSYSIGEINIEEGNSFIGGVFGLANFSGGDSEEGKIQNCYYDCNRCSAEKPIGKSEDKELASVKGLTTDQMTGTGGGRADEKMEGFKKGNGETSIWYFHDDDKVDAVGQKYAYYPNLEKFTSADAWIPKVKIFYGTFNGGEGSTGTMPPEKFYDGISEKLFENQFVKDGYTFLNWKASDGISYENQDEVILEKDTEFTAQWKGKSYKVKYNLNGGKMSTTEKTVVWNGKVLSEENPTRDGYDFIGWMYNDTIVAEDRTYKDLVSDDNVEFIELIAQWQLKDSFTVKQTDEKLTGSSENLQSGAAIATPANDIKTGDPYDLNIIFALIAIILVSGVGLFGMREKGKVK